MTPERRTLPNCMRRLDFFELTASTGGVEFNYFECFPLCARQNEVSDFINNNINLSTAPNMMGISPHSLGGDWPEPSLSIDLTCTSEQLIEARINRWIADLEAGGVLFALLPCQPTALLCNLNQAGIEWIGNRSPDYGTFRLFVRRKSLANSDIE